jgi:hypothetical protein
MPRYYCPESDALVPIPPPSRPPESPLLMGVNVAAALVFLGLMVNFGRALIA